MKNLIWREELDRADRAKFIPQVDYLEKELSYIHRYLDIKWGDIKRFLEIVPELYPPFLNFIKKEMGKW